MATRSNNEDAPTVLDTSLGPYLQQLRETQGFTLEQVSARIKYSRQQIAALEQENWAELPSGAPVRWLLRSYRSEERRVGKECGSMGMEKEKRVNVRVTRVHSS